MYLAKTDNIKSGMYRQYRLKPLTTYTLESKMNVGKHKMKTVRNVIKEDISYITNFCIRKWPDFLYDDKVIEAIVQQLGVSYAMIQEPPENGKIVRRYKSIAEHLKKIRTEKEVNYLKLKYQEILDKPDIIIDEYDNPFCFNVYDKHGRLLPGWKSDDYDDYPEYNTTSYTNQDDEEDWTTGEGCYVLAVPEPKEVQPEELEIAKPIAPIVETRSIWQRIKQFVSSLFS